MSSFGTSSGPPVCSRNQWKGREEEDLLQSWVMDVLPYCRNLQRFQPSGWTSQEFLTWRESEVQMRNGKSKPLNFSVRSNINNNICLQNYHLIVKFKWLTYRIALHSLRTVVLFGVKHNTKWNTVFFNAFPRLPADRWHLYQAGGACLVCYSRTLAKTRSDGILTELVWRM